MSAPRVRVVVEDLVVRGLPPHRARAWADAFRADLERAAPGALGEGTLTPEVVAAVVRRVAREVRP